MTFVEAMREANRRLGIKAEMTEKTMRSTTAVLPDVPLDYRLAPGTEEEFVQHLVRLAKRVQALTPEQRQALQQHIVKSRQN